MRNIMIDNDAPAMKAAFSLVEQRVVLGGRLAPTQWLSGEELCLQQGRNSLVQGVFQDKARGVTPVMGVDARSYTFRSGSNALGGTG